MNGETFQQMAQALLERKYRAQGELTQFPSAGADGAREATWIQSPNHPDYVRPANSDVDCPKHWVFQVKYHDIGLRGWDGARASVISDLTTELTKVCDKYKLGCHHFVLITNVPLTGGRWIGNRDRIAEIAGDWKDKVPHIELWDASDLSRMLDDTADVRAAYLELILPGDVVSALFRQMQFDSDRRESTFRGYLQHIIDHESKARTEEAQDDDSLPLSAVFIDQSLRLDRQCIPEAYSSLVHSWTIDAQRSSELDDTCIPDDLDDVPSSFPLLWGANDKVMLLAGPGYGKSTITQFLCLYHASRLLKPDYANLLATRLKLPKAWTSTSIDASCDLRFPFRIELRRYSKWRRAQTDESRTGIASYIATQLIRGAVESTLDENDIFFLFAKDPTLLILDGLDEVPTKEDRDYLLKDCDAFVYRCVGEKANVQIVMSSRPQGYNGEFDRFSPLRWIINDLGSDDFNSYTSDWINKRIGSPDEKLEAIDRIKRGMTSEAVRSLATTLLQATVMLTIVRKKYDIPEERHKLFEKYVDVVFQREKSKDEIIALYEQELRLLHETAGYQIHEAVARGEDGGIAEDKFLDLLRRVWCLIRGNMPFNGIVNDELKRLFDLSTDRLVFLSGKGSKQTDIDFIIQPYREYYAANYLSNHTEADPDKVFQCLIDRGPYWQQVLRFYVAIAKPPQQFAWAISASSHPGEIGDANFTVACAQKRRAVLFNLPECGRFQFERFRSVVAGAMPASEWWTWLNQEWAVSLLCTLRNGEAWRELWRAFIRDPSNGYGVLDFAFSLFPRAINATSPEYSDFKEIMSTFIGDHAIAPQVISAAIVHDIPISLEDAPRDALVEALQNISRHRRLLEPTTLTEILKRLPAAAAIEFLCRSQWRYPTLGDADSPWIFMGLPVVFASPQRADRPSEVMSFQPSHPYWLDVSIDNERSAPCVDEIRNTSPYQQYLICLFRAIQKPNDPELHLLAVGKSKGLPYPVEWRLQPQNVLGPSPNEFRSSEDWIKYKRGISEMFSKVNGLEPLNKVIRTLVYDGSVSSLDWLMLIFPPSQWDFLAHAGLLSLETVEQTRTEQWAILSALPLGFIELVSAGVYSHVNARTLKVPYMKLMRAAVELHNRGVLYASEAISSVLLLADVSEVTPADIYALVESIDNPEKLPETWARSVFEISIELQTVDMLRIVGLWEKLLTHGEERPWLRLFAQNNTPKLVPVIQALVKCGSLAALDLAGALLVQCPEEPDDLSAEINRATANYICRIGKSAAESSSLIWSLYRTNQTVEEIELYSDIELFKMIEGASKRSYGQIAARIEGAPRMLSKQDWGRAVASLSKIVQNKSFYPPRVAASAIDALIQIASVRCDPLTESDWQLSVHGN